MPSGSAPPSWCDDQPGQQRRGARPAPPRDDQEKRLRLRNDDAARLAARTWTVTATAEMAGLNVLTYLTAYLDACGRNGGKPVAGPDLERFLPWTADPADLRAWAQPPPPG
ncbi:MAG: hypothetical protein WCC65_09440 [Pseudonocardiaceae bacterium]